MTRPPQARPERTYSLTDSIGDLGVWCLQRPGGTVWRLSRTVDGVWQHKDYRSERKAREAAKALTMEKVA